MNECHDELSVPIGNNLPDLPITCGCGRAYWPLPGDGGECGVCRLESGDSDQEPDVIVMGPNATITDGQHRLRAMVDDQEGPSPQ